MMKLIIDIDEDYYNIVQKYGGNNYVEDAVLNGIPLDDIKEIINNPGLKDDLLRYFKIKELVEEVDDEN